MRRLIAVITGAAIALVATSCYRDFDFTGDAKADHVVVDRAGTWTDLGTGRVLRTGDPQDMPVPGDWDGDHNFDVAVVTRNGHWITQTPRGTISFPPPPVETDFALASIIALPVPLDYDGDGDLEPAWYRESDGVWFIEGHAPIDFGDGPTARPGTGGDASENDYDFPIPADYDGDGRDDLAVFNPRTGDWTVRATSTGAESTETFPPGTDVLPFPVPADLDQVGHAQRVVYSERGWQIEGHLDIDPYGAYDAYGGELGWPAVADYDGDNRLDLSALVVDNWDSATWSIEGQSAALAPKVNDEWPVATGFGLSKNTARFLYLGFCRAIPDAGCW